MGIEDDFQKTAAAATGIYVFHKGDASLPIPRKGLENHLGYISGNVNDSFATPERIRALTQAARDATTLMSSALEAK
jgi:hypothetical protein